jgi:hypothetical protein
MASKSTPTDFLVWPVTAEQYEARRDKLMYMDYFEYSKFMLTETFLHAPANETTYQRLREIRMGVEKDPQYTSQQRRTLICECETILHQWYNKQPRKVDL